MASSLDTDSFIHALRCFIARRGQVKELRSDNGTNFVGTQREMREAIKSWNQDQIHNTLLPKGINWIFHPPTDSHHGGVWERLNRSVRKVLNSTLNVQILDERVFTQFYVKLRPFLTVGLSPKLQQIQMTLKHLPRITFGFLRPNRHCHQDSFREKIYMLAAGGDKFSICQICSGKDGQKNIFPNCRNAKNGLTSDATSHEETS